MMDPSADEELEEAPCGLLYCVELIEASINCTQIPESLLSGVDIKLR